MVGYQTGLGLAHRSSDWTTRNQTTVGTSSRYQEAGLTTHEVVQLDVGKGFDCFSGVKLGSITEKHRLQGQKSFKKFPSPLQGTKSGTFGSNSVLEAASRETLQQVSLCFSLIDTKLQQSHTHFSS